MDQGATNNQVSDIKGMTEKLFPLAKCARKVGRAELLSQNLSLMRKKTLKHLLTRTNIRNRYGYINGSQLRIQSGKQAGDRCSNNNVAASDGVSGEPLSTYKVQRDFGILDVASDEDPSGTALPYMTDGNGGISRAPSTVSRLWCCKSTIRRLDHSAAGKPMNGEPEYAFLVWGKVQTRDAPVKGLVYWYPPCGQDVAWLAPVRNTKDPRPAVVTVFDNPQLAREEPDISNSELAAADGVGFRPFAWLEGGIASEAAYQFPIEEKASAKMPCQLA
ncbi:uncharacterized protein CLUP02_03265 [Colletotrichum lupini]|uniref:Uncharacterized protein n=1 Tax=Colletotrichum lupini TaxID=145971 RepID=A0A9Q8SI36_9PEZI|nr:uncharacterized protein CLUP02_03265 [Colletotrichum lupini]UQC77794.1 hypothetical protein CLUP02_03265 [Colletotrichum lupini]